MGSGSGADQEVLRGLRVLAGGTWTLEVQSTAEAAPPGAASGTPADPCRSAGLLPGEESALA